jgi:hypothetical protein
MDGSTATTGGGVVGFGFEITISSSSFSVAGVPNILSGSSNTFSRFLLILMADLLPKINKC